MTVDVHMLRSGALARAFCQRITNAKVEAVFDRCFYLRSGDDFVCVGGLEIGNGPLTLIADLGGRPIMTGDAVRLVLDRSEPWRAPAWPLCAPADRLVDTCTALAERAAIDAPEEGVARIVFGSHRTPLARIAGPRLAAFETWLHAPAANSATAVHSLIGLGPGLTPSGDDFFVGSLALLDAFGDRNTHAALGRTIIDAPPGLTTPLSACFLKAASAGHISEALHRAVSSVITGDADAAIAALGNVGHSSGWDTLAGIASALRVTAAMRATTPPAAHTFAFA